MSIDSAQEPSRARPFTQVWQFITNIGTNLGDYMMDYAMGRFKI
jgi:hypothetical protein